MDMNEVSELPKQFGELYNLRSLLLDHNVLTALPMYVPLRVEGCGLVSELALRVVVRFGCASVSECVVWLCFGL